MSLPVRNDPTGCSPQQAREKPIDHRPRGVSMAALEKMGAAPGGVPGAHWKVSIHGGYPNSWMVYRGNI